MNKNNKPSITIVTPSFNQGEFIERTILSVLNQNYPNLQYIIKDGGSTDNTKQIVKKYQKYLTFISKKDNGQSDAINQGFKMANGEILAWLNSDDCYKPGTLDYVGNFFKNNQNSYWLTGDYEIIDKNDNVIREYVAIYKKLLRSISDKSVHCVANYIVQPSTF